MMKLLFSVLAILVLMGCKEEAKSSNALAEYFYPINEDPIVYVYRDAAKGVDERYHRIYRINDSHGEHLVVEIWNAEARLLEAYNYNVDSLDMMDHMVVDGNRKNQKGQLGKTQLFPLSKKGKGEFLSRIPGPKDSTYIIYTIDRKVLSDQKKTENVLGKDIETLVFSDDFALTLFNSKDEATDQKKGVTISYYAKGFGLVRWHDDTKDLDFKLEKVMSETEWAKLVLN